MSIKDKQQRRQETQAAGDNRGQREPSPQLFPGAGPSLLSHFGRGLSGIGRPRPGAVRTAGVEGAGHVWGCHFRVTDHLCSPDPGSRSPPSARGRHGTRSGRRVRWGRRQRPICDPVGWAAEQAGRRLLRSPPHPVGPRGQAVPWPSVYHQLWGYFLSLALNLFLVFSQFTHVYSGSSVY